MTATGRKRPWVSAHKEADADEREAVGVLVRVGNAPIDPGRDYRIVTHEGMLKGLHRYLGFAAGREPKVSERSVTEVVEEALRRRGVLRAPQLGNVTLIKSPDS